MAFRRFGGLNYSSSNNIVHSTFSNTSNLTITNQLGNEQSNISVTSNLDMNTNNLFNTGTVAFQTGYINSSPYTNLAGNSQTNVLTFDNRTSTDSSTFGGMVFKNATGSTFWFYTGSEPGGKEIAIHDQTISTSSGSLSLNVPDSQTVFIDPVLTVPTITTRAGTDLTITTGSISDNINIYRDVYVDASINATGNFLFKGPVDISGNLSVVGGTASFGRVIANGDASFNQAVDVLGLFRGLNGASIADGLDVIDGATFRSGMNVANGATFFNGLNVQTGGAVITDGGLDVVNGGATFRSGMNVANGATFFQGLNVQTGGAVITNGGLDVFNGSTFRDGMNVANGATFFNGLNVQTGGLNVTGGATFHTRAPHCEHDPEVPYELSNKHYVDTEITKAINPGGGIFITNNVWYGTNTFENTVDISSNLIVRNGLDVQTGGAVISSGGVDVTGGATFRDGINVDNGATFFNGLNVRTGGAVIASGGLDVTDGATFRTGAVIASGGLDVTGGATFRTGINVANGATFFNGLNVQTGGAVIASGGLDVTGGATFRTGAVIASGGLDVTGGATFRTGINVANGATFFNGLNVQTGGVVIASGGLDVTDGATFRTGINVDNGATFFNGLNVRTGGAVIASGGLDVTDGATFRTGAVIASGGLDVTGGATFRTGINVDNGATFFNGLNVQTGGAVIAAGGLDVTGGATFRNGINVANGATFFNGLNVRTGGAVIASGGLDVTDGATFRTGAVIASGGLDVTGGATFRTGINVANGATFFNGLNVQTGGAVIAAGGFDVSSGGATFRTGINVANGATFFNGLNVQTGGAVISSGGLDVSSGGATFRTGINVANGATFFNGLNVQTGGAVISSGGLDVTGGATFRTGINVANGATFFNGLNVRTGGAVIAAGGLDVTGGATFRDGINVNTITPSVASQAITVRTTGGTGLQISSSNGLTIFDNRDIRVGGFTAGAGAFFGCGASTSDLTNTVSGFNSSRTVFNSNGQNTIYGSTIGTLMDPGAARNTIIGANAGNQLSSGNENSLLGSGAGQSITTGTQNTAVGQAALLSLDTGNNNTAIGRNAGSGLISGANNTCIGSNATCSNGISNSTAIGFNALAIASNTIQLGTASQIINCPGIANTTSTATGALVVSGGVGIGGTVNVGGGLYVTKSSGTGNDSVATFSSNTSGQVRTLAIVPNAIKGSVSNLHENGDIMLFSQGPGGINSSALSLSLWSDTIVAGLRIAPQSVFLGWGGSGSTPQHMLTFNASGSVFNTVPKCATGPSGTSDLCNKTYVDQNQTLINATSLTSVAQQFFPVFVAANGANQTARVADGVSPLGYFPNTATLLCSNFSNVQNISSLQTSSTSLTISSQSTNIGNLIIRHQNTANPTGSILIHTSGDAASGQSIALKTGGASGLGLTVAANGSTTFDRLITANNGITVPTGQYITSSQAPSDGNHLTNKTYVDAQVGKINAQTPPVSSSTHYPTMVTATGLETAYITDASGLSFLPSTGTLTANRFSGYWYNGPNVQSQTDFPVGYIINLDAASSQLTNPLLNIYWSNSLTKPLQFQNVSGTMFNRDVLLSTESVWSLTGDLSLPSNVSNDDSEITICVGLNNNTISSATTFANDASLGYVLPIKKFADNNANSFPSNTSWSNGRFVISKDSEIVQFTRTIYLKQDCNLRALQIAILVTYGSDGASYHPYFTLVRIA
jgi:hypothetical protein